MTDVNQNEEAAKALELGKKALEAKQFERAIKLFEKSIRMRKTVEAETMLTCAKNTMQRHESRNNVENVTPSTPPKVDRPYTKEQEEACRVVLEAKTHYETLQVEKSASADEIKKSYRKLALKFHPDKCSAPKADEAFKKISKAFKILIDADERAHYDRYGDREDVAAARHANHGNGFHHGNFQEMDPDELFRAFFGGMDGPFGNGGVRFHYARHPFAPPNRAARAAGGEFSLQPLISFVIMIIFLVSSMGSFDTSSQRASPYRSNQVFSLNPDKTFNVKRSTAMHGVVSDIPYYVDPRFASTIARSPRDLYYVEREVESTLHQTLKEKCQSELIHRTELLNRARAARDQAAMEKANKMETPSCTRQLDLERRKRGGS